jgi:outer membrane immunogenic protein
VQTIPIGGGSGGVAMKLRNVLLTHVALFAAAGVAPSVAAPASGTYSWSGPYVGVEGGVGWGHSNQSDPGLPPSPPPPPPPPPPITTDLGSGSFGVGGGFIGGTVGYNWQNGPWVLGLEGDYSWADISGSSTTCGFAPPHACGTTLESFGTFRGRFGYAVGPGGTWLPYITGGLAAGEVHAWDALTPASGSAFRVGWTVGVGIETVLSQNWTFKLEYLYMDLGSGSLFDIVPGIPETVSFRANLFRIGVNYKFWGPEPSRPLVTKN